MNRQYDDILRLPHHVSPTRPQMSMADRAAQFSPFAALNGYDAAIRETGRLTNTRIELTEDELTELDRKYQRLTGCLGAEPAVRITFFRPDSRKDGGSYVTVSGIVKKIDTFDRLLSMKDGTLIPMDDIFDICFDDPCSETFSRNTPPDQRIKYSF